MSQLAVPNINRKRVGGIRSKGLIVMNDSRQSQIDSDELRLADQELDLIQSLRNGDEKAFNILIDRHYSSLLRLAMTFVPNRGEAEQVVHETWMGVLEGIVRFEERSSLKTWLFRILISHAKTRGIQEKRSVAFADIGNRGIQEEELSENPEDDFRSRAKDSQWAMNSRDRAHITSEKQRLSNGLRTVIAKAIQTLPLIQQQVITLGDIERCTGADICKMLDISENKRRVILHRARCQVQQVLEEYLTGNRDQPTSDNGAILFVTHREFSQIFEMQMTGRPTSTILHNSFDSHSGHDSYAWRQGERNVS